MSSARNQDEELRMITIMGATGNTGRAIADALLAEGRAVRVLGRSAERLADLAARGAEVMVGDAADADHLTAAFRGAEAVYTLQPPNATAPDFPAYQDRVGEAIATAVARSGVRKVVMLSSVGADVESDNGPIAGLFRQEERLRAIPGIDLLILRPGYFLENLHSSLPLVRAQGILGGAFAPDLAFAATATRDIAAAAARSLVAVDFHGIEVRELLGPAPVTFAELAAILGERLGLPALPYVQFPYDGFAAALEQAGLSASVAGLYAEMAEGFNSGRVAPREGWTERTTTPTGFADFVGELVVTYRELERAA
jgi:uncharacterized protein YbjT (DUF2867 family)